MYKLNRKFETFLLFTVFSDSVEINSETKELPTNLPGVKFFGIGKMGLCKDFELFRAKNTVWNNSAFN